MLAVVVVVVIAIVAYLGLSGLGYKSPIFSSTTSPPTTLPTTTVSTPLGTVSTTTIGSGSGFEGCLGGGTAQILNGAFSTGNYLGWTATGGFGTAPSNVLYDNSNGIYYGSPWTGYSHPFFATTFTGGISVSPGNLTSNVFQVTEPYLNFQIVSAASQNLYLEILKNGQPAIRAYYNTFGSNGTASSSTFKNASISLAPLLCSNVTVRVVSSVVSSISTRFQFIGVSGFYLSQNPVSNPGVLVNQSILAAN